MLHKLSSNIADKMISAGIVESGKGRILAYGLEVMLSSIGSILLLAGLSACLGVPTAWFGFLAGLAPLRMAAGGYHAKTQMRCYLLFGALYTVLLTFAQSVPDRAELYLAVSIIALLLVLWAAPIQAHNKPLPSPKRNRNRKHAIGIAIVDVVGAVLLCVTCWRILFVRMYYWGVIAAIILMIAALIDKKEKEVVLS